MKIEDLILTFMGIIIFSSIILIIVISFYVAILKNQLELKKIEKWDGKCFYDSRM